MRGFPVLLLLALYAAAAWVRSTHGGPPSAEAFAGLVLFAALGGLTLLFARGVKANRIVLHDPWREAWLWTGWFAAWLVLNLALWRPLFGASAWLSNGVSFWGLLVVLPAVVLAQQGYRPSDVGLTLEGLRGNLRVTLLSAVLIGGFLLMMTPGGQFLRSGELPADRLALGLLISFVLAFLLAGFHEEFFFRAILQTRLSEALGSRVGGIALATLLFGLYHLPFRLHRGVTEGDLVQSLAVCLTETTLTAFVLGALWARTRNLLAPVALHTLIDTISGSRMILQSIEMR